MKYWTEDEKAVVERMLREDFTLEAIGRVLKRSGSSVRGIVDREPALRKLAEEMFARKPACRNFRTNLAVRQRKMKERRELKDTMQAVRAAGIGNASPSSKQADRDWRRQIEVMPRDTRSLTGRILGDPLPDVRAPWRGCSHG